MTIHQTRPEARYSLLTHTDAHGDGTLSVSMVPEFAGMWGETYRGNAHMEAREAGIRTCMDRDFNDPGDCVACEVEDGHALMIAWGNDLDREAKALAYERAKNSVARALDVEVPAWQHAKEHMELTPEVLKEWRREADLGVCTDIRKDFGRDYRILALLNALVEGA